MPFNINANWEGMKSLRVWVFIIRIIRSPIPVWWAIGLFLAGLFAWTGRYGMNPDGIQYSDIAVGAANGDPGQLVNSLWSPAYPALISLILEILRPDSGHETQVVHLTNFIIFIFSLFGFSFFLKNLRPDDLFDSPAKNALWVFYSFGFCIYFWFVLRWIGLKQVAPDLLMAGMVLFIAGLVLKLSSAVKTWKSYFFLGLVMGLGYYVKAPLFTFGIVLFLLLFFFTPPNISRKKLLLSLFAFSITVLPYAVALSRNAGHLTVSESARLNYIWHVNKLDIISWSRKDYSGFGSPVHPPRLIFDKPLTLEFAEPINGTCPLISDPSYWFSGANPRFNLKQQISAFGENRDVYGVVLLESMGLIAGGLILFVFYIRKNSFIKIKLDTFWLFVWPLMAAGIYAFVHTELRYLAAFSIIFWLALYNELAQKMGSSVNSSVLGGVVLFYFICLIVVGQKRFEEAKVLDRPDYRPGYEVVLRNLHSMGVKPLDRIAVVGDAGDCYFAHLGGLKIVAETFNVEEFQNLGVEKMSAYLNSLKPLGIKAVVVKGPLPSFGKGWKRIVVPDQELSIFIL